jgi:hypothetical protein
MRWPMRDTRLWERHAYTYEMAYGRGMPMRDARLWDGFCEMHAYERHAYLHRLEKRGEPSWPAGAWLAGAWRTGRLTYRVPPAAISRGLI